MSVQLPVHLSASGLTSRPLSPGDVEAVYRLVAAAETHDIGEAEVDLEDIVGDWQRPSFHVEEQAVGIEAQGLLVAYAEVFGGRYADAQVLPEHRGRGIGSALARWTQEEARRQGGSLVGMPVPLGSDGDRLLIRLGYHVRWTSWVLALPPGTSIPDQPLPEGYLVREMQAGEEHTAYRLTEDAFNEWPDRTPATYEDWAAEVFHRPGFEPWQLRLVVDPSGTAVGVSFVVLSTGCGYIYRLAVQRDRRGLGLGRALLADSFAQARARGATRSELSTDSRTGALGLYERVGMEVTQTWLHRAIEV